MFIATLALLSCQVSTSSPIPEKYWAYLPDPTFQVVTWNCDPLRVHTNQPQLLGGSYTSHTTDKYPINFNFTFRGLTDDLPVCFNFPNYIESFITTPKEGCIGASKKAILTHSPASSIELRGRLAVWMLQARMPGALDPHKTVFHRSPPGYPSCYNTERSDIIWNTIDDRTGYPIWKSYTYDSRIDYRIPGGGNYMIQDWSNPDPGTSPLILGDFLSRYYNWKKDLVPWPLSITRWHNNQFVPPILSYTTKNRTFWQPEIWRAFAASGPISLFHPDSNSTYSVLACLP